MVEPAGHTEEVASCGWHPEVGGASVEDDSEVLWWRPQPNFPIILGIHVVGEGHEDGLVPRG